MSSELTPIRTKRDYEDAMKHIEALWGAKSGPLKATGST
jgi:hypothetical protein